MNTTSHAPPSLHRGGPLFAGLLLTLAATLAPEAALAAAKFKIKATWSDKAGTLTIKGSAKGNNGPVDVYDINGRRLGSGQGASFALTLARQDLGNVPCAVRIEAGGTEAVKLVKGAPKSCAGVPTCSITSPADGAVLPIGVQSHFQAMANSSDPTAQPLKYEWDFAGGAMGHPTDLMAMPTFIRDNSHYRVRFSATDAKGRRCEDAVEVVVGTPPVGLPGKVSEQSAPKFGGELDGAKGDVVVMPFESWTYQGVADHDFQPNQELAFNPPLNMLNALAYRKDRLPVALDPTQIELRYSAASNPSDPAGAGSINSTSRNWNSAEGANVEYILDGALQKTDIWDRVDRRGATNLAADYVSRFIAWQQNWPTGSPEQTPARDEGYVIDPFKPFLDDNASTNFPAKSARMPGFANPYQANDPQAFAFYDPSTRALGAGYIPVTDADDTGRVNPYPLMRVQAVDKSGNTVASTDGVMTTSRDHHCRECHAKGKIAANPNAGWSKEAFHYSVYGKIVDDSMCSANGGGHNHEGHGGTLCTFAQPEFFEPAGKTLRDQEDAAMKNVYSLHDFYDGLNLLQERLYGAGHNDQGQISNDGSFFCAACHSSPTRHWPLGVVMWQDYFFMDETGAQWGNGGYWPNYTMAMHKLHGRFQRDPSNPDNILREASGVPKLWDPAQGANPNTLFPVKTASGESKPMEENCLQCHAGQREQQYRDRMYTAGVTCYDCHGDMLAQGLAYEKSQVGADGNKHRVAYYDEPDCGSCHTGNANDGGSGFFSAGVMKRAFDDGDRSATTRPPKTERFAVQPKDYGKMPTTQWMNDPSSPDGGYTVDVSFNINERVYRDSKDKHGDVACGACHGPAHGVWPNRDPSSNDNVTALQLQGHTGTILECNVCHTADSFAKLEDLDGGQYSGDAKPGILGGPHDMHPVNDPYWWKQANGDVANSDGGTYGGWHNNYAKMPGANGEDQCAACHGNDHKGTRLSKTPVDRVFDFRGFDGKKLKKAGFKTKVVKVAAGTPIGCDTCHSLETSFKGSPGH
ncbi:cytochrome C [Methylococcus geothermalis]|uniref:Cytochrome C n=1 Tax=Methylococcus geothermalis TaxID=2681310 RepID=A0A858Q839_9GAMM|nr:cytochrome C [Methylococcus geothermalis]QJD29971.1 cytochrome C [Methylococcus geothermalis]